MFKRYDRKADGMLDLNEFELLCHKLTEKSNVLDNYDEKYVTLNALYTSFTSYLLNSKTFGPVSLREALHI